LGGITIYDLSDNDPSNINSTTSTILSINNGLLTAQISTLHYFSSLNLILAGSTDGVLTLINEHSHECQHFTGIRDHNLNNPKINDILVLPDSDILLIAGGFGLVEFDLKRKIFGSSIFTIGDFSTNTSINNIILSDDTIWVSTPVGLGFISCFQQYTVP